MGSHYSSSCLYLVQYHNIEPLANLLIISSLSLSLSLSLLHFHSLAFFLPPYLPLSLSPFLIPTQALIEEEATEGLTLDAMFSMSSHELCQLLVRLEIPQDDWHKLMRLLDLLSYYFG